ncbi:adhesin [Hyphomicrobium sp.]|uniref:adhesin n=1 Tax=Hyphomicrobium sp. TaxID=82 RepID=UPI001DD19F5D|nr:adhesin [Hyphomicrobium sp.]MBY0561783.1 adhesin [Hyphomicrobium sp.]
MFALSNGRRRVKALRAVLFPLVAGVVAVSVAGCATDNDAYYAGSYSGAYPGSTPAEYVAQGPAVQMEADGLPEQAAPSARIRAMPDDPNEPFSPNYGGANPADRRSAPATASRPNDTASAPMPVAIPADLPPSFRRQLVAAVDAAG